tara:strand:- start:3145 stop:3540 length:396 start_codon:yes stop_codon:yes gene_type:complete
MWEKIPPNRRSIVQIEFTSIISRSGEQEGFYATFDNGWVMSVQWGPDRSVSYNTVEVSAWNEDYIWWDFAAGKPFQPLLTAAYPAGEGSSTLGWVTSDKLGGYMDDVASITTGNAELELMTRGHVNMSARP